MVSSKNKRKNFKVCRLRTGAGPISVPDSGELSEPDEKRLKIDLDADSESKIDDSDDSESNLDDEDTGSLKNFNSNSVMSSFSEISGGEARNSDSVSPISVSSGCTDKPKKSPVNPYVAMAHANPSLEHYIVRFIGTECGFPQCKMSNSREHFHCKQCQWRLFTKKGTHPFITLSQINCPFHQDYIKRIFITAVTKFISVLRTFRCTPTPTEKPLILPKKVFRGSRHPRIVPTPIAPFLGIIHKSHEENHSPNHRTTHFHCLRPGCTHSFKNKSDMDKHKAHHLRDEQLIRDGFKKFMKTETCLFPACAFSRVVNHIHCIRPGCDYILHSTSQMYSHKRKHEKHEKRVAEAVPTGFVPPSLGGTASAQSSVLFAAVASNLLQQQQQKQQQQQAGAVGSFPSLPAGILPNFSPSLGSEALKSTVVTPSGEMQSGNKLKIKHYSPAENKFKDESPEVMVPVAPAVPVSDAAAGSALKTSAAVVSNGDGFKIKIKQYDPTSKNFVHTSTIYSKQAESNGTFPINNNGSLERGKDHNVGTL